jgi:hypothetical protein
LQRGQRILKQPLDAVVSPGQPADLAQHPDPSAGQAGRALQELGVVEG